MRLSPFFATLRKKTWCFALTLLPASLIPSLASAFGGSSTPGMPVIGGIRIEFILFALTLIGVAVFHNRTFWVALAGLTVILAYKIAVDPGFHVLDHFMGHRAFADQLVYKDLREGEWAILLNLLGLLLGFAILSKTFEESGVPDLMPKWLPDDWKGPFMLLVFVFVLSSFLDNIAAALIGGAIASVVFNKKVHVGYLAAIVAASNAGGAGSVVGDTTTTMMWIDGVSPLNVLHAYVAAGTALVIVAWFAARQQHKLQPISANPRQGINADWKALFVVVLILGGAIAGNVLFDMPAAGVWAALALSALIRKMPWKEAPASLMGTVFLLCLVTCASMMPVDELPPASSRTAFVLGFISAVFDNIPLTKLCLEQGCYDWGMLAYTVGFGGSMIWFGSSAGVAICNKFPQGRNVGLWLRKGWHVTAAYIIGFVALLLLLDWEPGDTAGIKTSQCPAPSGSPTAASESSAPKVK
jgi:Na+/H+ antiporter NhaD/arsenite permease-like protein